MAEVVWTPGAIEEVVEIARHVAVDSPRYASLLAERLFDAGDRVGLFPNLGRVVPETDRDDIREVFLNPYRIMYLVTTDRIDILAVIHGARDVQFGDVLPRVPKVE